MTPVPTPQPADDHGAAGFCGNHAQHVARGVWLNPDGTVTSPIPSNTASSAAMLPRTDPRIEAARAEALRRWPGQSDAGWVRHGYVLGFTDAIAALDDAWDDAQDDAIVPAPDARTETVARVLREHQEQANDAGHIACQCEGYCGISSAEMAAHQAAAVVAALDDETARLRAINSELVETHNTYLAHVGRIEADRDAARAALDRVRALTHGMADAAGHRDASAPPWTPRSPGPAGTGCHTSVTTPC